MKINDSDICDVNDESNALQGMIACFVEMPTHDSLMFVISRMFLMTVMYISVRDDW
jgi:hypothetical protein